MRILLSGVIAAAAPIVIAAGLGMQGAAQTPAPNPLPGTKLSLEELRKQMFHVSAGRRLKPASWPGGAQIAVSLSFDVDNATATLSQGVLDYEVISRGEYGAVDGLPRILRLMERHQIPASFFFLLTMHPHITGHRSRVALLDRLIQHMKSKPGVWFATHEDIARHVKNLDVRTQN